MASGLLIRLQPTGPWRLGPATGDVNRVDPLLHSDTLFAAVTHAVAQLDSLEEWLQATARNPEGSSVLFSSGFPYLDDTLFIVPPRTIWPPASSSKVRWEHAQFVPTPVVKALLQEQTLEEDRWRVDLASGCLVASGKGGRTAGPFRVQVRQRAAVDRGSEGVVAPHQSACIEFRAGAGIWTVVAFQDDDAAKRWSPVMEAAFRLLGDSGIGGERSSGWGHFQVAEFRRGDVMELLSDTVAPLSLQENEQMIAFWLLSLCSPAPQDEIDWRRGNYEMVERSGRVSGTGQVQQSVRMLAEGSVVLAGALHGVAREVTPEGAPHPVYRAGFALGLPIPIRGNV